MARLPRLYAPAAVQYVVQRAAEGRALFVDADDYALFLDLIGDAVRMHGLALHAYVLLPREVRLLATPLEVLSIARVMQTVGRRYVPYVNRKAARSGPLWDRRYRSTLVDADAFLLPLMQHIERRPVVEALVQEPSSWLWSSYRHHAGYEQRPFVTDHACYWALSDTPFERQAAYRDIVDTNVNDALARRFDHDVERGWVLGDVAFVDGLADMLNRRARPIGRGRKPKLSERSVPN